MNRAGMSFACGHALGLLRAALKAAPDFSVEARCRAESLGGMCREM
jgi:hypothetical protein